MPENQEQMTVADVQAVASNSIRSASEINTPQYFGLHIGSGGSGKTSVLGSLPGKTLIIDSEDGTLPLRDRDNVDVWVCSTWRQFREALFFIERADYDYESVGIDGLSRFQQYDIAKILKDFQKPFMEMAMWGVTLEHMSLTMAYLRAIGIERGLHIGVSVLEKEIKDSEMIVQRAPDLQGQIKDRIAPMFDNVSYHMVKEHPAPDGAEHGPLEFRVLTKPYGTRNLARDRYKVLHGVERLDLEKGDGIASWMQRITAAVEGGESGTAEASGPAPTVAKPPKNRRQRKPSESQKAEAKAADTPPEPAAASTPTPAGTTEPQKNGGEASSQPVESVADVVAEIQKQYGEFCQLAPQLEDQAYDVMFNSLASGGYEDFAGVVGDDNLKVAKAVRTALKEYIETQPEVV